MRFRVWPMLALGVCSSTLWGCSGDPPLPPEPILHPVRGKVSAQGKPLAHAVVTFLQVDQKGTTAVGETDDDGEYELSYLQRPGAAAADYKVAVSYIQGSDGTVYGLGPRSGLAKPYGFITAKELIPPEWSNLGKTTQKAQVVAGGGVFNFDIQEPLLPPPEPQPATDKAQGAASAEKPASTKPVEPADAKAVPEPKVAPSGSPSQ
jgi:hypothetical protein